MINELKYEDYANIYLQSIYFSIPINDVTGICVS